MNVLPALPTPPDAPPSVIRSNSNSIAITIKDYLTLLVAQAKNQNPLSPAEPGDTLLQLVSLAQVSSRQNIKATLEQLLPGPDDVIRCRKLDRSNSSCAVNDGPAPPRRKLRR